MKKILFIVLMPALFAGYSLISCKQKSDAREKPVEHSLLIQIDRFSSAVQQLRQSLTSAPQNGKEIQRLFLQIRLAYKSIEWAAEYFEPVTTRLVNGPPVPQVELPGPQITDPAGLQVIEALLFPQFDSSKKTELIRQLDMLQVNGDVYKSYFTSADLPDWQVFDAAKLEVFRIITLGITGFDNPLTLKSMQESGASLSSLKTVLDRYEQKTNDSILSRYLDSAIQYLNANPDFNSFNRMQFITAYGNPVTVGISRLQNNLKIKANKYNRLLNQDAATLFDSNAFNVNAYAPDHSSFISGDKIVLGQKLFADPILSGTGKRSCQSCHQPARAFADGLAKNTIIDKHELLERNTPTLINAALQPALFDDLRVNSLEDQSVNVVQSSKEMHGSMTMSVRRLWKDTVYRSMFLKAFPSEDSSRIDTFEVMNAIGSYIRSLVLLNSRFDEYMRGNKTAMTAEEINGFNLFMGKAKCATCHYMPLFNGTFPPRFKKMESEVIAVPQSATGNNIDPDPGRFAIIPIKSFLHAFKTSTVRNAARTAPYMHNGVFNTLEEVVEFYNRGGGAGLGIKLENQTLPTDSLRLSGKEQNEIVAFIKSLDSK